MPCRNLPDDAEFDNIVAAVREHTHTLLGLTITFSDEQWAAPSRLTGWTRSHVAAHLADNAHGLTRVCRAHAEGRSEKMYDSDRDKTLSIERGSLEAGIDLQVRLDESAGILESELSGLAGDETEVTLRAGYRLRMRHLPLARLHELVLHTFDLLPDAPGIEVKPEIARDVLQFAVSQIGDRPGMPAIRLIADEGFEAEVGTMGEPRPVRGPAAELLAWLSRGVRGERLEGAFEIATAAS